MILLWLVQNLWAFHPVENVLRWFDETYTQMRTYPRMARAYRLLEAGREGEAQALLEKVIAIDPNHPEAMDALVTLCLKRHDQACLRRQTDRMRERHQGLYHLYLAERHLAEKRYEKARTHALQALNQSLDAEHRYYTKLILIDADIATGRYAEASDWIDRLYRNDAFRRFHDYLLYLIHQ